MIDYEGIEKKWQAAWAEARLFEGEIGGKKPYMVTAAFPYANAPQHIGHLRTYGTADVLARYKRMQGFNVLYPMGFHATGTPVLAFAKRFIEKDKDLIAEMKLFHIPDEDLEKMTDPVYIANYFTKELEKGMHKAGYSIDWRRKFTSIDPFFSKFIEWQFGILNNKGLLTQGKHPVGWCPNENNAVGMHDTKHDVEPEIEKETLLRFKVEGEDAYVLCVTYRPETIFGITNIFVAENAQYVLCQIKGMEGNCYISKASSEVLKHQFDITIIKEITGKEMLQKKCLNERGIAQKVLPIFPGFFVKESLGSGIVMSVPSHAPFDYAAIQRLKNQGYNISELKPAKLIEVAVGEAAEGKGPVPSALDLPALAYLKLTNADENSLDDLLESATKLQYREESHWGKMIVKGYEGMSEPEAREHVRKELMEAGEAFDVYTLVNSSPVFCRCGSRIVIKTVENQWFINYGDSAWKEAVKNAYSKMHILPEKSKNAFESAINWIDLRAVVRAQGLGTKFPFDKNYIIESLSDSTIYMSFYTISNLIRDIEIEKLKPEFFGYIFLGEGNADKVAESTGIDPEIIRKCSESFSYWYKNTSRHSALELIFNHLTMYIFNHVAIFGEAYWPKQIVTNGMVLMEGEKMSKSLGNIVPLLDGIKNYGADPLRVVVVSSADLFSDSEFSNEALNGVKERFEYLFNIVQSLESMGSSGLMQIDYWLYSKLNRKIRDSTASMEALALRDVATSLLYDSVIELKRYFARGGGNSIVVKDYMTNLILMLQPMAPHLSEELWHILGNNSFASIEKWPTPDETVISDNIEDLEALLESTIVDAKQVSELMKKKENRDPTEFRFIVASDWKREVQNRLAEERNSSDLLEEMKGDATVSNKEAVAKYIINMSKKINEIKKIQLSQKDEYDSLKEAEEYLGSQLRCKVVVEREEESKSGRAGRAMPGKPSIDLLY